METNNVSYCTPEKMVDQILELKSYLAEASNLWDHYFYANAKDR